MKLYTVGMMCRTFVDTRDLKERLAIIIFCVDVGIFIVYEEKGGIYFHSYFMLIRVMLEYFIGGI